MSSLRSKNVVFQWTQEHEDNFRRIKELFTREGGPVRRFPLPPGDPQGGQFVLHIDFSKQAVAAILHQMQRAQPGGDWEEFFIACKGRKLMSYEQNYHSSKGELLALYYGVQKFSHFLMQAPFRVMTDSKTVTHWETMRDPGGTVRRWLDYLQSYSFTVEHRAGKLLTNADSLSRSKHLLDPSPSEASAAANREEKFRLPCGWDRFQGAGADLMDVGGPGREEPAGCSA